MTQKNAMKIWGTDIPSLKGKTTRKAPEHVPTNMVAIPTEIRTLHKIVTLSIDVFFVNNVPFFLTLSRKICFSTITHLENRKIPTIYKAFKSIFMYYLQKGFQIMTITADNEFAPLAELLYELPGAPTLNLSKFVVEFVTPQPYKPSVWLPIHGNGYISQQRSPFCCLARSSLALSPCHRPSSSALGTQKNSAISIEHGAAQRRQTVY